MESANLFEMKERYTISSVKVIMWSVVVNKVTNTLIFYIFEHGAEYGANQYFIFVKRMLRNNSKYFKNS